MHDCVHFPIETVSSPISTPVYVKPMDCEERLVRQAAMTKAVNASTRVMVYRNLVKALPWYTSVREKITVRSNCLQPLIFTSPGPFILPSLTLSAGSCTSPRTRPTAGGFSTLPRTSHRTCQLTILRFTTITNRRQTAACVTASVIAVYLVASIYGTIATLLFAIGSSLSILPAQRVWAIPTSMACTLTITGAQAYVWHHGAKKGKSYPTNLFCCDQTR
jgi:hypothetical protein